MEEDFDFALYQAISTVQSFPALYHPELWMNIAGLLGDTPYLGNNDMLRELLGRLQYRFSAPVGAPRNPVMIPDDETPAIVAVEPVVIVVEDPDIPPTLHQRLALLGYTNIPE